MSNVRRGALTIWYIIPIAVLIDQLTKYLAISNIGILDDVVIIPGILSFTHVLNSGAFMGLFPNYNNVLSITAAIISCGMFIFLWLRGNPPKLLEIALILVVSGAIGNIIDRLVHNSVIDFIKLNFIDFPIFNLADVMISIGAVLLAWYVLRKDKPFDKDAGN